MHIYPNERNREREALLLYVTGIGGGKQEQGKMSIMKKTSGVGETSVTSRVRRGPARCHHQDVLQPRLGHRQERYIERREKPRAQSSCVY